MSGWHYQPRAVTLVGGDASVTVGAQAGFSGAFGALAVLSLGLTIGAQAAWAATTGVSAGLSLGVGVPAQPALAATAGVSASLSLGVGIRTQPALGSPYGSLALLSTGVSLPAGPALAVSGHANALVSLTSPVLIPAQPAASFSFGNSIVVFQTVILQADQPSPLQARAGLMRAGVTRAAVTYEQPQIAETDRPPGSIPWRWVAPIQTVWTKVPV